jgi:hypothetical protein
MDPIGAVCYATTGRLYDDESWQEAANAIGLSLISAADLVAAANDRTWKGDPGNRQEDAYLASLRQQLMEAVELKLT